ncbi:MAG: hypothetical protein JXB10_02235 [Pirellulales bacterium]|nr:hypothetical protein [Pirellulales bacterium]
MTARPAPAQFWRGPGYYDDGGWASAVALASSNAAYNARAEVAAQDRLAAQQASNRQARAMESNIQNTLSNQARTWNREAANQWQSDRDWWFQTQRRQMAGPAPRGTSSATPLAGGYGLSRPPVGGLTWEEIHPKVDLSIIKWPPVLQESAFAPWREKIETPYRRSPPGLSTPTAADYRNMVRDVEEMKAVLEWRLGQNGGLPTADYDQAKAFLNNLAREAQERAQRGGAGDGLSISKRNS